MAFGTDDTLVQVNRALGAEDGAAWRVFVIAADSERQIDTQVNAIGVTEFNLRVIAHRAQDPNIGDDPLPGSDDRDKLFGGKFALLIKIFQLGQLRPGPEERFKIRPG